MKFQFGDHIRERTCDAPTHIRRGYCWIVGGVVHSGRAYELATTPEALNVGVSMLLSYVDQRYELATPRSAEHPTPEPRGNLLWLAIDLDGTLAEPQWTADNPTHEIGKPIERNIAKLREAVDEGYKVVIYTSRGWHDYEAIELWLNHYEIPFKAIVCGKLLANRYIDDRATWEGSASWVPGQETDR